MDKTYKQIVKEQSLFLKQTTHIPQKEVEILLLYLLDKNIIWLHINYNKICDEQIYHKLKQLVQKRATNYPLEYIISKATFYGETFIVTKGVLIPRPETEILVEKACKILETLSNPKVVEVGVGSGVISIMLALLVKDIQIVAVDINDKALELAKQNAIKHNVENKITFIKSDIFQQVDVENFDMCISNPPYIANNYKLPSNVTYEPSNALFGGEVGDEILQKIIQETKNNNIKYLCCEMGYDQKDTLGKFLENFDILKTDFYKDLENFDRGFVVEFNIKR